MRLAMNAGLLLILTTMFGTGVPRAASVPTLPDAPTLESASSAVRSASAAPAEDASREARRRYHFLVWNFTKQTINVHLASSLAGCSSDINGIKPGNAAERGNYHDKWDKGKICAGACWTAIEAYDASGRHVVHVTPGSDLTKVVIPTVGAGTVAPMAITALIVGGPLAAGAVAAVGAGITAVASVMGDGGPCHGADIGIWRDETTGGWKAAQRFDGDYQIWQSLMKDGK